MRTQLVRTLSRLSVAALAVATLGIFGAMPAQADVDEATTAVGESSELKVVSYKIMREGTVNGVTQINPDHPWYVGGVNARRYKVIKYIQRSGASVVNLQEAEYRAQRANIKNSVSLKDHWAMIEHNVEVERAWQQRPTIMYDTRKVVKVDAGVRKIGTNALGNPMFVSWARFQDKKSLVYFYVFNAHFASNSGATTPELKEAIKAERDHEMAVVIARINEIVVDPSDPVILTGDFNSTNGSAAIVRARDAGLRDAHNVPGIPITGQGIKTNPDFSVPTETGSRLDRVFFKDNDRLTITSYTTDVSEWLGSDHIPVFATFTLTPQ